jgi:hypothetical protein
MWFVLVPLFPGCGSDHPAANNGTVQISSSPRPPKHQAKRNWSTPVLPRWTDAADQESDLTRSFRLLQMEAVLV